MSDYEPKIVHLRGTRLTPDVVLHRTLAKLDHIDSVVVAIRWKEDGSWSSDWSQMKTSDLAFAVMRLFDEAQAVMRGDVPEAIAPDTDRA